MKLGLAIDLDTCVGCHACAVACKAWNAGSPMGGAPDRDPHGKAPSGVWFNRVRHYVLEGDPTYSPHRCGSSADAMAVEGDVPLAKVVNVPMICLHCEEAQCVTVCPTGASYKRAEDGIVLVDPERCMGCNYCAWACPYGARELDHEAGVMRKCTLCVDRIYDERLPEAERQPACVLACPTHARHFGDFDDPDSRVARLARERGQQAWLPDLGYRPTNAYLPPRPPAQVATTLPEAPARTLAGRARAFVNRLIEL